MRRPRSHKLTLAALATLNVALWLPGVASGQNYRGGVRNMMHCGLRPSGVTERESLDYASRMGYEWVLNSAPTYAHSLGLKTIQWTGNGYGNETLRSWVVDVDFPKWVARCPVDTYAQFYTPYWLCLQSADARKAALQDMETRLHRWSEIGALFFDSATTLICTKCRETVNCTSKAHIHEFGSIVDAKARFIGEVRDQAHRHGVAMAANIWDGRAWVNKFMTRSDYATFEPDSFYVETGPLAWGSIFDYIDGDRLMFQARDRQSVPLGRDALGYIECAGTIASHNAWFGFQNYYSEPADAPVFSDCSAEVNLLRALPNWENLNGAVSRRWYCARNYARDAVADSHAAVYSDRRPSKAIDGLFGTDLDDGWTGGGTSARLDLVFQTPVAARCVRVNFGSKYTLGIDYEICAMVSDAWVKLISVRGNHDLSRLHEMASPAKITKLRYQCLKSAHPSMTYVQEIEVFSDNPDSAMEYRSEYSLASNSMVYSIHPYTDQAFVVFKDPHAIFDVGRVIDRARTASNTWSDTGDASSKVIIEGASMRLNLKGLSADSVKSKPRGSAFVVYFERTAYRDASADAIVNPQYVSEDPGIGLAVTKTVEKTDDGWLLPGTTGQVTIDMNRSTSVTAVRVSFPSRSKVGVDYDIDAWDGQEWKSVCRVRGNTRESRTHVLSTPVTCARMRYACKRSADTSTVYLKSFTLMSRREPWVR